MQFQSPEKLKLKHQLQTSAVQKLQLKGQPRDFFSIAVSVVPHHDGWVPQRLVGHMLERAQTVYDWLIGLVDESPADHCFRCRHHFQLVGCVWF